MPLWLLQLLASVAVFGGVFLPIWALFRHPMPTEAPVHRRMARALGADAATVFEQPVIGPVLAAAGQITGQLNLPGIRARIRQDLDGSGNASGYTVEQYLTLCVVSALAAGLIAGVGELMLGGGLLLLVVPLFLIVGFMLPLIMLANARQRRVIRIARQLPYTLDLVSLVMQAGSSFNEAVEALIRDDPNDDLNQELQVALSEMQFGTPRAVALENIARRIPLETLRSVIAAVNQADQLGTPLAYILKTQADMLRNFRAVVAEKKSASASLRILIPSMLILAAVVLVVFGPVLIRYTRGELLQ
ncbi:MAG: type II secretion system F family protein [Planctomycetota bacterium]